MSSHTQHHTPTNQHLQENRTLILYNKRNYRTKQNNSSVKSQIVLWTLLRLSPCHNISHFFYIFPYSYVSPTVETAR